MEEHLQLQKEETRQILSISIHNQKNVFKNDMHCQQLQSQDMQNVYMQPAGLVTGKN